MNKFLVLLGVLFLSGAALGAVPSLPSGTVLGPLVLSADCPVSDEGAFTGVLVQRVPTGWTESTAPKLGHYDTYRVAFLSRATRLDGDKTEIQCVYRNSGMANMFILLKSVSGKWTCPTTRTGNCTR